MRKILLGCLMLSFSFPLWAQLNCTTLKTDSGELQICHLQNGQKSTVVFSPKVNPRWKTLTAYNTHGNMIYQKNYGQRWGSSGVDVRYYANGALKSARYTMQPDGGIQYTDITTFFTADGKFDHESNDGTDMFGHRGPQVLVAPSHTPPAPQTQKPNECAPVPAGNTCFLINNTSDVLNITAQYKPINASPFDNKIEPGDTLKIGIYYPKNDADGPLNSWKITVHNKAKTGYHYSLQLLSGDKKTAKYIAVYMRNNDDKK